MPLESGKYYDCHATAADFHESKKSGALMLKVKYLIHATGEEMDYYHMLVAGDGTVREFPVDRKNPDGPKTTEQEILEKRYGVDLSSFEFDQSKLSEDIVVRALVEEESGEYNGRPFHRMRISRIYPARQGNGEPREKKPLDKKALMSRFGSALRAGHASSAAARPAVAAPNSAPPKKSAKAAAKASPKAPAKEEAEDAPAESTLDACWQAFNRLPDVAACDEDAIADQWFDMLKRVLGHDKQESATPEEWGKVAAEIEKLKNDNIPF